MNLTANSFLMNLLEVPMAEMLATTDTSNFHIYGSLISAVVMSLLLIPLQLKTESSALKNISVVSLGTLFYVMIICAIEAPQYVAQDNTWQEVEYFNSDSGIMTLLQNLGIFIFSYNITTTYHVVKSSLADPSENRLRKMGLLSVAILYLPYVGIGVLGYVSLGSAGTLLD